MEESNYNISIAQFLKDPKSIKKYKLILNKKM
jgi:hypothetical protein